MRRTLVGLLLSGSLALVLTSDPARSQTTPPSPSPTATLIPTPTVTPTPTPLSAKQLIARMKAAVKAKGSAHVSESGSLVVPRVEKESLSARAYVSSRDKRAHIVASSHTSLTLKGQTKTFDQHEETISVGRRAATRFNGQVWAGSASLPGTYDLIAAPPQLKSPVNLGPETINQVPVWHVRAVANDKKTHDRYKINYYIAQADYTLVRQTIRLVFGTGSGNDTLKLTLNYSNYGEPVTAKLPAMCKSSASSLTVHSPSPGFSNLLPGYWCNRRLH